MSTTKEINSLAGVKERQTEVRKEIEMSQNAIVSQLKATADDAKDFALNDVLLPAAGIADGAYVFTKVVKYAFRGNSPGTKINHVSVPVITEEGSEIQSLTAPTPVPARQVSSGDASGYASAKKDFSTGDEEDYPDKPVAVPIKVETESSGDLVWTKSLLRFGSLLIPAGRAIMKVIENERK